MVNNIEQQLDSVFQALSDQTRRAMLQRLVKGECNVTELAKPFSMSLAAVSKHLKVLEAAGLVQKTKAGRKYHCRPQFEALHPANALLEQLAEYWNVRLDALESLLETTTPEGENRDGTDPSARKPKISATKSDSRKTRKSI